MGVVRCVRMLGVVTYCLVLIEKIQVLRRRRGDEGLAQGVVQYSSSSYRAVQ